MHFLRLEFIFLSVVAKVVLLELADEEAVMSLEVNPVGKLRHS